MHASDWKEVITMALSKIGQVTGGEIVVINHDKGFAVLELDSAERASLCRGNCKGDDRSARFDSLEVGMELRVLVLETTDDRFGRPFHRVTERLDTVIEAVPSDDGSRAKDAGPDPELVAKFPTGKSVKGKFLHVAGDAIVVLLDGVRALLPLTELGTSKAGSFRKDVPVSARVLRIDGSNVVLSRRLTA